jgi:hypothetical protein
LLKRNRPRSIVFATTVKPWFAAVVVFGALFAGAFLGFGVGMTVGVKVGAKNNRQLNAFMDTNAYGKQDVMFRKIYGLLDRLGKYEQIDLEKEFSAMSDEEETVRKNAWAKVFPAPKPETK